MSESYAVSEKRELLLERVRKFILDNGGIVKKSQLAGLGPSSTPKTTSTKTACPRPSSPRI